MFGHQDDKDDKSSKKDTDIKDTTVVPDGSGDSAGGIEPARQIGKDISPPDTTGTAIATGSSVPVPDTAPESDDAWQHPGVPIDNDSEPKGPEPISDVKGPSGGGITPSHKLHNAIGPNHGFPDDNDASDSTPHELIDIKQKALGQLTPLIDQLDQTPEDKFRTTMMMIQASDDQSLVKLAYESANAIEDEKAKAQALLDIVNEINYFTQHSES